MATITVGARRCCERYPLRYPAVFSWCDEQGERHVAEGMTRDLAMKGAYINATTCPPVHSQLVLEVRTTNNRRNLMRFSLNGKGEVCRADVFATKSGFAVRIGSSFRIARVPSGDVLTSAERNLAS